MKNMSVTLFVNPEQLSKFLIITKVLEDLPIENDYVFNTADLKYNEAMISSYLWVNVSMDLYLKLKYCENKLKGKL